MDHMNPSSPRSVPAVIFKAKCLALLDDVAESRRPLIVTKRGRPVARVVPIADDATSVTCLKGTVLAQKDLVAAADEIWEADET
jgi:prevent-host-death family protein